MTIALLLLFYLVGGRWGSQGPFGQHGLGDPGLGPWDVLANRWCG